MGKEAGVHYTEGNTKTPPRHKYFIEGWWSSDEAGNKIITEALVGDHVYFHVKTKHIPDGESIYMRMFDFDNTEQRLTFKFAEPIENVTKKLKSRGYVLLKEEIKIKEL